MDTKELVEFIMFVGIPASGKTTEAEKYRKKGYAVCPSRSFVNYFLITSPRTFPCCLLGSL